MPRAPPDPRFPTAPLESAAPKRRPGSGPEPLIGGLPQDPTFRGPSVACMRPSPLKSHGIGRQPWRGSARPAVDARPQPPLAQQNSVCFSASPHSSTPPLRPCLRPPAPSVNPRPPAHLDPLTPSPTPARRTLHPLTRSPIHARGPHSIHSPGHPSTPAAHTPSAHAVAHSRPRGPHPIRSDLCAHARPLRRSPAYTGPSALDDTLRRRLRPRVRSARVYRPEPRIRQPASIAPAGHGHRLFEPRSFEGGSPCVTARVARDTGHPPAASPITGASKLAAVPLKPMSLADHAMTSACFRARMTLLASIARLILGSRLPSETQRRTSPGLVLIASTAARKHPTQRRPRQTSRTRHEQTSRTRHGRRAGCRSATKSPASFNQVGALRGPARLAGRPFPTEPSWVDPRASWAQFHRRGQSVPSGDGRPSRVRSSSDRQTRSKGRSPTLLTFNSSVCRHATLGSLVVRSRFERLVHPRAMRHQASLYGADGLRQREVQAHPIPDLAGPIGT